MKISICSDHAGFLLKSNILNYLKNKKYDCKDYGTNSLDRVDYPDYVNLVVKSIKKGQSDIGILVCGSGNGVCMAANRHKFIRACICWNKKLASLAREHNNANVLCLPARFINKDDVYEIVNNFIKYEFQEGRHLIRLNKINSFLNE